MLDSSTVILPARLGALQLSFLALVLLGLGAQTLAPAWHDCPEQLVLEESGEDFGGDKSETEGETSNKYYKLAQTVAVLLTASNGSATIDAGANYANSVVPQHPYLEQEAPPPDA